MLPSSEAESSSYNKAPAASAPALASGHAAPVVKPTGEAAVGRAAGRAAESPESSGNIPKHIWVTGQWNSDSDEVNVQMANNIGYQPLQRRAARLRGQVEAYFAKWVPVGSYIRYVTDTDMDNDVRHISKMLVAKGITDLEESYFNLRPGAFRADVWRIMKLWAEGGVYLDANINLTGKLTDWIDFSKDHMVVVQDSGDARFPNAFWNAMMAAEPRNKYLENAISLIAGHLRRHYYGLNPLAITGPIALGYAFRKVPVTGFPHGLRVALAWKGGKVTDQITGAVVATKDEALHDKDPSKHYDPMWRHGQVYCDQKGPEPDNGRCART
jgi:hypothetical protein